MVTISGGSDEGSRDKVSQYTLQGWVRDLPQLQQGRYGHGCGHYLNDNNIMVSNIDNVLLNCQARVQVQGLSQISNKRLGPGACSYNCNVTHHHHPYNFSEQNNIEISSCVN